MLYKYAPFPETGGKLRDSNNYIAGSQFETVDYADIPIELCKLDVNLKDLLHNKNDLTLGDYIDRVVKIRSVSLDISLKDFSSFSYRFLI